MARLEVGPVQQVVVWIEEIGNYEHKRSED
jgi:hypothetical protein